MNDTSVAEQVTVVDDLTLEAVIACMSEVESDANDEAFDETLTA